MVDVRRVARENDREVKFGLNGFIIARDTEAEAKDTLREIIAKANRPAVEGFKNAVQQAGASTASKDGMWRIRRSRTWFSTTTVSAHN